MTKQDIIEIIKDPSGDMDYLYLTISQARYLLNELNQTIKNIGNDITEIVVPFPKEKFEEVNNEL